MEAFAAAHSSKRILHGNEQPRRSIRSRPCQDRQTKLHLSESIRCSYDAHAYRRGLDSAGEETSTLVEDTVGEVPAISGTFLSIGPGKAEVGITGKTDVSIAHPRDGDGMIAALSLYDGKVWVQNRFVRTKGYVREGLANRVLYRGAFGTQKPGGWANNLLELFPKNTANEGLVYHGNRLLALWSLGKPHLVEPAGLISEGPSRLGGVLPEKRANFCSRPKIDPTNGDLVGYWHAGRDFCFVHFDQDFKLSQRTLARAGPNGLVRDFAVSENWYILIEDSTTFDSLGFGVGKTAWADSFKLTQKPCNIWMYPRSQRGEWSRVSASNFKQCLRVVDCKDDSSSGGVSITAVVISESDQIFWGERPSSPSFPARQLVRLCVVDGRVDIEPVTPRSVDHATVSGAQDSYLGLTSGDGPNEPTRAVVQVSREGENLWIPDEHQFCGPPVFVPGAAADDQGFVMTLMYDGVEHSSALVILDGDSLTEVCRIQTGTKLPYGLCTLWTDTAFRKEDARKKSSYEMFMEKGWNTVNSEFSTFGLSALE
eukprot:Plantae.Rhodophyta-Rhodochaete_pulchella.ctg6419.p1 GENE.Plantae.Rhodophyta-Rhodochaete_pulchella.ctg6419~~Plantae.Rhodophyta-Rhodochaete_pulchella.ctg6419.p1  ORF type:complete len:540 (-),score=58.72 Plantae.Rhodophyta-Rhodochaete_pulchella.ctg6419:109-1728(-)